MGVFDLLLLGMIHVKAQVHSPVEFSAFTTELKDILLLKQRYSSLDGSVYTSTAPKPHVLIGGKFRK